MFQPIRCLFNGAPIIQINGIGMSASKVWLSRWQSLRSQVKLIPNSELLGLLWQLYVLNIHEIILQILLVIVVGVPCGSTNLSSS